MCTCCNGRRTVLAADGQSRPCSRCQGDEFSEWYREAMRIAEIGRQAFRKSLDEAGQQRQKRT
jgi:hypothetical protein